MKPEDVKRGDVVQKGDDPQLGTVLRTPEDLLAWGEWYQGRVGVSWGMGDLNYPLISTLSLHHRAGERFNGWKPPPGWPAMTKLPE